MKKFLTSMLFSLVLAGTTNAWPGLNVRLQSGWTCILEGIWSVQVPVYVKASSGLPTDRRLLAFTLPISYDDDVFTDCSFTVNPLYSGSYHDVQTDHLTGGSHCVGAGYLFVIQGVWTDMPPTNGVALTSGAWKYIGDLYLTLDSALFYGEGLPLATTVKVECDDSFGRLALAWDNGTTEHQYGIWGDPDVAIENACVQLSTENDLCQAVTECPGGTWSPCGHCPPELDPPVRIGDRGTDLPVTPSLWGTVKALYR